MTIDTLLLAKVAFKVVVIIFIALFVFMFVCWPINDKPTSKTQYFVFFSIMAFIAAVMFGYIQFK